MHGCQRVRDAGCVGRSCKNGTVAANSNDKSTNCAPQVPCLQPTPPEMSAPSSQAWKISCHVALGAGKPAIAQLVEHLTVELCSYQMVPGSIPGGRICTDLSFGCSAGSNILLFHSQVVRTSGKQMFQKSLAPARVSHGAFHGFGSVPFDPFVRLFLIFYVSFLRHVQSTCDWWS